MNGFRSRGLVLEESDFLEAREAFLAQLSEALAATTGPAPSPQHRRRLGGCASAFAAGERQHAPGLAAGAASVAGL